MSVLKCILIVLISIVELGTGETKKDLKNANYSRNFEDIVNNPFFVDKSLLIKELLNEHCTNKSSSVVRVLAPPKYGKTINNDMVKKFLEVVVDDKGELQGIKLTKNYRIFAENNLNIFRDKIFEKHFGKHPVISINLRRLREVTNFDHMIDIYRQILRSTFSEHKYLLSVERLWQEYFNKSNFELYFDENHESRLHKYYIFCGFSVLSEVLHVHFGRPVYVLIDDFNAIEDCPAYVTGEDKRRIFNFVKEVNDDLLLDNEHLVTALLVGTLKKKKKDKDKRFHIKLECSQTLWRYYGLSNEELKSLLIRFIKDEEEREKSADIILKEFSGAPMVYNGTIAHQPCSIWSVEHFFSKKEKSH